MKHIYLLLIVFFFCDFALAQQGTNNLEEIDSPKKLLPYSNPLIDEESDDPESTVRVEPNELEKDTMTRISDVYRMHVLAIDAQVQNDLVQAESHINDAFAAIQSLMDDYPEVQNNNRFTALYRAVMAEYREFYAISESTNEVEGDIFLVQDELFSEKDEWIAEGYNLPDGLTFSRTSVPLVQNQHVNRHLMYYTLRRPQVMEKWLERSEYYFPMMKEIFEEEGTPTELIHLSMIESGLIPTARSWASAVGLWQFIRATGSMYGLEVNWWVDERRDPVKSTRAAARHLKDLHDIWGDWHLAMAGYNISPRGLRRAIRSGGGEENYWVAFPHLPRETRGYVPGFIAATMIAMNPEEFGFEKNYGGERYRYDVARVDGLMPLDLLAEAAGITTQELKNYNPELLRWATPPGDGGYPLKLPQGTVEKFLIAYKEIPRDQRADEITMHTVASGETLGFIARRYGTSVRSLFETNENLSNTIHPGQRIVVPIAPGSMEEITADRPSNQPGSRTSTSSRSSTQEVQAPPNTSPVTYSVKSGDTIGHIAEWFDVRAWQIRAWNGIGNTIRMGQKLTVHVPTSRSDFYKQLDDLSYNSKQDLERQQRQGVNIYNSVSNGNSSGSGEATTYTVRRNETLGGIANRQGVSVSAIQRANNLNGSTIYAGQTLTIPAR